jgi:large subunit ribosomal protein L10e
MPLARKEYAPGAPGLKIAKFSGGTPSPDYEVKLQLVATRRAQIRQNALEAARIAINKGLADVGTSNYFMQLKIYPHVILRENKMIAAAGADRLQEGMRKAWGKPVGLAARVKNGSVIFEVSTKREFIPQAKEALRTAASKLPIPCRIIQVDLKPR